MKKKAVFLDRDGTIIKEKHYLKDPSCIELLNGAVEGLKVLIKLGFRLIIITNQSGIKRGFFTEKELGMVHIRLRELLAKEGIKIDAIYFSPDLPEEESMFRKPQVGFLEKAEKELDIKLSLSYCIGDKIEDIEMGKRKDLRTILVLTGYGRETKGKVFPDFVAADLYEAALWIKRQEEVKNP